MRSYGSVQVRFWEYANRHRLSDQASLLAIYLLTGPHSNMLGCIRLPDGYITEDLRWDIQTVKNAFEQLTNINFLCRDEQSGWLVIHDFLKWNPIQNPKQGIGMQKLFENVPDESTVFKPLIKSLLTYNNYLDKGFVNRLYRVFNNWPSDQEQDQNQDKYQEQKQEQSGNLSLPSQNIFHLHEDHIQQSEAIEVLNFLNDKANKAYEADYDNLKWIKARLKDGIDVDTCRQVIVKKCRLWRDDKKMNVYLRPSTLFSKDNFPKYKGELVLPEEKVSVSNE
jgi:uncharacterized phage protein (TIGR02220 family)